MPTDDLPIEHVVAGIREVRLLDGRNIWRASATFAARFSAASFQAAPSPVLATLPFQTCNRTNVRSRPADLRMPSDYVLVGGLPLALARMVLGLQRAVGRDGHAALAAARRGTDDVWIAVDCADFSLGMASLRESVAILVRATKGQRYDLEHHLERLRAHAGGAGARRLSAAVSSAAAQMGIPARRLGNTCFVELGLGAGLRRIDVTALPQPLVAVQLARDAPTARTLLREAGLSTLPVASAADIDAARAFAVMHGYPIRGWRWTSDGGRQELYTVHAETELKAAWASLADGEPGHFVERCPHGIPIDALVCCGRYMGRATDRDDVPSDGGSRHESEISFVAERSAAVLGLQQASVRLVERVAVSQGQPPSYFLQHVSPHIDVERLAERDVLSVATLTSRLLDGATGARRVPIVAVTGTNGKTSTVRMVVQLLQASGHRVGWKTSEGIFICDKPIARGDSHVTHPLRALSVSPEVQVVVLESARNMILQRGLGTTTVDYGIVLNVANDHLGEDGVNTLEDLAVVKRLVAEAVSRSGYAILNAADRRVRSMAAHVSGRIVWLWPRSAPLPPFIRSHVRAGGSAVSVRKGQVVVWHGGRPHIVCPVAEVPLTLDGLATFVIPNVLAAVATGYHMGLEVSALRDALTVARPLHRAFPGRLNRFAVAGATVIVDQAHNLPAVACLLRLAQRIGARRRSAVLSMAGDRHDDDVIAVGELAGRLLDTVIVREQAELRGRRRGEVAELLCLGLKRGGMRPHDIQVVIGEREAIAVALDELEKGDVLLLLATKNIDVVTAAVMERQVARDGYG